MTALILFYMLILVALSSQPKNEGREADGEEAGQGFPLDGWLFWLCLCVALVWGSVITPDIHHWFSLEGRLYLEPLR